MKILILGGSGRIGSAAAWDLARDPEVKRLGIAGRSDCALEKTRRWLGGGSNVVCHEIDVEDRRATSALLEGYDATVISLPDRRTSYRAVDVAIDVGAPALDLLEEHHRTPDLSETEGLKVPPGMTLRRYGEALHEKALMRGVTLLDGMGFAPGLSNITVGEGIRRLDRALTAVARVGGIPDKRSAERHPLRYMITWTFEHVLREYVIRHEVRRDGRLVEVEAGTEREAFVFDRFGRCEALECALTPGMPSFLRSRPDLLELSEKTIRWPGHWQAVETLKECGLLATNPVAFKGSSIIPREFLDALLSPRLRPAPGDRDVCVMYNTVTGMKAGAPAKVEHFLWDEGDPEAGLTAMMRVTGFPAALGARLLAKGAIKQRGIVPPEDAITGELYEWFIRELAARGVHIDEVLTPGS